ncbi:division/cell wall cluster transcriptional repressor MraZ [Sphingomonas sp. 35-24ZXX]|uniref:division/cell wall cluster transcriptional repressor MraZ n=1 Tax=Sphingomonas sp. 35-24ZXX TaxID=1545915 RepID=UPI00053BE13C|nr:division/cell wall cluster transcriptional repressor MraZ [Sphingomonas sp. 35-24ZXX]
MAEISAFLGSALTTIDPKGRMAIPAIFRNPIITSSSGESSVVFSYNAQAQCLQGYGTERLSALLAQMRRREELANESGEEFRTEIVGGPRFNATATISFDGSGRLILPKMLVAMAKIEKHVFFSGNGTDFSVWGVEHLLTLDDPRLASHQFNARFLMEELGGKR